MRLILKQFNAPFFSISHRFVTALMLFLVVRSLFARCSFSIFFKNIFAKRTVFVIVGIAIFMSVFHFAFSVFEFVYTGNSKIALTFYRVTCCGFKKRTFCKFIVISCHWVLPPCNIFTRSVGFFGSVRLQLQPCTFLSACLLFCLSAPECLY